MTENKEIPTPSAAGDAVDRYDIAQGFGGGRMEKIYGGNWVDYDDHERVVTDLRRNLDDALRTVSEVSATNAELRRLAAETKDSFKNFHRRLCERLGYVHYDRDWQHDQLIELIAKRTERLEAANTMLREDARRYENAHAVLIAMAQQRWLPIESAPKDGTEILTTIAGFVPCVSQWNEYGDYSRFGEPPDTFEDWAAYDRYMVNGRYTPTHWQPLPPPPIGDEIAAGTGEKCDDCPPVGYPTDKTRCDSCPNRSTAPPEEVKS